MSNTTDNFKWTDSLASEFARYYNKHTELRLPEEALSDFKKSKQEQLPIDNKVFEIRYHVNNGCHGIIAFFSSDYDHSKIPEIKQAIECLLNNQPFAVYGGNLITPIKKVNDGEIEGDGKEVVCRIQVGMIIQHMTNEGWCKLGEEVEVLSFDMEKDHVYTSDKQNWSIAGFLENINTGKFKVTYYPKPLPENKSKPQDNKQEGWIVMSVKDNNGKIWQHEVWNELEDTNGHGFCGNTYGYVLASKIRPNYWSIHSVQSNGDIFTVGEEVLWEGKSIKINGFEHSPGINGVHSAIMFYNMQGENYNIHYAKKQPPQLNTKEEKPLFITEDGVKVFNTEGLLWRVFIKPHSYEMWRPYELGIPTNPLDGEKYFTTPEAAEQYILENKPCLSLKEVVENSTYQRNIEGVKDNPHYLLLVDLIKQK